MSFANCRSLFVVSGDDGGLWDDEDFLSQPQTNAPDDSRTPILSLITFKAHVRAPLQISSLFHFSFFTFHFSLFTFHSQFSYTRNLQPATRNPQPATRTTINEKRTTNSSLIIHHSSLFQYQTPIPIAEKTKFMVECKLIHPFPIIAHESRN